MIVIRPNATHPTQSWRSSATDTKRVNQSPAASDANAIMADSMMLPQRIPRLRSVAVKRRGDGLVAPSRSLRLHRRKRHRVVALHCGIVDFEDARSARRRDEGVRVRASCQIIRNQEIQRAVEADVRQGRILHARLFGRHLRRPETDERQRSRLADSWRGRALLAGVGGRSPGKIAASSTPLNVTPPMRSPFSGTPLRHGSVSPLDLTSASRVARTAAIAIAETPAPWPSARCRAVIDDVFQNSAEPIVMGLHADDRLWSRQTKPCRFSCPRSATTTNWRPAGKRSTRRPSRVRVRRRRRRLDPTRRAHRPARSAG